MVKERNKVQSVKIKLKFCLCFEIAIEQIHHTGQVVTLAPGISVDHKQESHQDCTLGCSKHTEESLCPAQIPRRSCWLVNCAQVKREHSVDQTDRKQ